MVRWIASAFGIAAVLACGAAHGVLTGRWGSAGPDDAVVRQRLERVPLTVGDWVGRREDVPDARLLGGVAGCTLVRYTNAQDGATVSAFLVGGRPGPVSIHTPDACYPAAGYELASQIRVAVKAAGVPPAEFWTAELVRTRAAEQRRLRIDWAWSGDGHWSVPDSPRLSFARVPTLYKLYVVRESRAAEAGGAADPSQGFLREFLPAVQRALFTEQ